MKSHSKLLNELYLQLKAERDQEDVLFQVSFEALGYRLTEWCEKTEDDAKLKMLDGMIQNLNTLFLHNMHTRNKLDIAVANLRQKRKDYNSLAIKHRETKKELELSQKEIEFMKRNGS